MENINIPQLLFFAVIGLVIVLALQRWFMAVDAQLSNQKKTIELLTKLCQHHGIDTNEPAEPEKKAGFNS